jgi:hypothetical protein
VKGRFETLSADSNKMFTDLVAKGEKIEAEGKVKVEEVKAKVAAKTEVESRVEAVRTKLGLNNTDADQKNRRIECKT